MNRHRRPRAVALALVSLPLLATLTACDIDRGAAAGPSFPDSVRYNELWWAGEFSGFLPLSGMGFLANGFLPLPTPRPPEGVIARIGAGESPIPARSGRLLADLPIRVGREFEAVTPPEGCTLQAYGGWVYFPETDTDQNGIPDDAYYRLECVTTDPSRLADTMARAYSFVELHLRQRSADLWGWEFEETVIYETTSHTGWVERSEFWHSSQNSRNSGGARYAFTTRWVWDYRYPEGTGLEPYRAEERLEHETAVTPDSPIAAQGPLPSGDVRTSGEWQVSVQHEPLARFTLGTSTLLRFDASCFASASPSYFTAGQVIALLNGRAGGGRATVTFTECDAEPTPVLEGAYDQP